MAASRKRRNGYVLLDDKLKQRENAFAIYRDLAQGARCANPLRRLRKIIAAADTRDGT
jgi:hypothetical protein